MCVGWGQAGRVPYPGSLTTTYGIFIQPSCLGTKPQPRLALPSRDHGSAGEPGPQVGLVAAASFASMFPTVPQGDPILNILALFPFFLSFVVITFVTYVGGGGWVWA